MQARTEVGIANWVTLEIKQDRLCRCFICTTIKNNTTPGFICDRVYQTFLRMVFENVRNLCAISGDAFHVLPHRFNACSVNSIFINHPEPPVQYGGESKRQKVRGGDDTGGLDSRGSEAYGKHLLNLVNTYTIIKIILLLRLSGLLLIM